MTSDIMVVSILNLDAGGLRRVAAVDLTDSALEVAPRSPRGQSLDALSIQANIAGYKAVKIAADRHQCLMPRLIMAARGGATLRFQYET